MPKWKRDATEFPVSINYNDVRGYQSSIPKPVMEILGNPNKIVFVIDDDQVLVKPIESEVLESRENKTTEPTTTKKKDVFEKVKELAERRRRRK